MSSKFFSMSILICCLAMAVLSAPSLGRAQDPDEARRLQQDGEQAVLVRQFDQAEPLLKRLLAIQEKSLGAEHNDTIRTIFYLGAALSGQRKHQEANRLNRRSISLELLLAINNGDTKSALSLLERGANPNARNPRGRTASMYAGIAGQTRVMKKLLEMGAEVRSRMAQEGTTALMAAITFGDPETTRLLLAGGADPNAKNSKGETVLAQAKWRLGNSPRDRNVLGRTLPKRTPAGDLSMATQAELEEVIEILRNAGASD